MDIQEQIDNITKRIDDTLIQMQNLVISIIESKEKVLKMEISYLNDRVALLEEQNKNICHNCISTLSNCKCEINYMTNPDNINTSNLS